MVWIIMFVALWLPTLVFAVAIDGRSCFLGFHDWNTELDKNVGKFMPYKTLLKCAHCGKVMR